MKPRNLLQLICLVLSLTLVACSSGGGGSERNDNPFNPRLSIVSQWNELGLAAVRSGSAKPTVTARQLFLLHVAIYDAWTAYDADASPLIDDPAKKRPVEEHTLENKRAAISQAAYRVLVDQFPQFESENGFFAQYLADLGYVVEQSTDGDSASEIGASAAAIVLSSRRDDGANESGGYADITSATFPELYTPVNSADPTAENAPGGATFNPNRWQPLRVPTGALQDQSGATLFDNDDPSSFSDQSFLTPHFGAVLPFALSSGSQFVPPAPPQSGSSLPYTDARGMTSTNDEAYNSQFDEVLAVSAGLTDRQKVIAEFWADGPRTESPPGHWNQLAHGISVRDSHDIDEDVKMYFALNGAIFDAAIATWEAKRRYDFIRPSSAIRNRYFGQTISAWGGPNLGTQEILGQDWRPYQNVTFVTPPFPEFVSGHSAFSRAAAEVLTAFTGSTTFYDGTSLSGEDLNFDGTEDLVGQYVAPAGSNAFESGPAEDVVLQWATFQEAADEAGLSRIFGGIHIQDGDLRGRELGLSVGQNAYAFAAALWTAQ